MARNTTVACPAKAWTQLTNADVTTITFQNRSAHDVLIAATSGAVAPTSDTDGLLYKSGQGEINVVVADLAPGVAGANRVYAMPVGLVAGDAEVLVSHA